jgi:peptide deformylase
LQALDIKKYPDPVLKKTCQPLEEINKKDKILFEEMVFTMQFYHGIGLAAPQIGIPRQLIIVSNEDKIIKFANPKIIEVKGEDIFEEGCLSVPETFVKINRPYEIKVIGLNEEGKIIEFKAKGLVARVFQHEIDHLNGKLIIDYLVSTERDGNYDYTD